MAAVRHLSLVAPLLCIADGRSGQSVICERAANCSWGRPEDPSWLCFVGWI